MGDENPIRTLGDYSKPSHEGYRNTIELPVGNNVDFLKLVDSLDLDGDNRERTRLRLFQFSLRDQASNWLERLPVGSITTWEDLTTRLLAQFFPPGRTAKLYNDILMFQQHHGESLSEEWTRFKDLLQKVPHHDIDRWLQTQIFYDRVNCITQKGINYSVGGRLRKLNQDKAWATIERVAQYEDEGWNDAFTSEEDAISLIGKSESVFWSTTNEMCRPPTEPSRQEEFEHIAMNFIYDQEERIRQLENYMQNFIDEFMEFSSEVALRLKERIKENESKPRKIKKITKYPDTKVLENSAKHNFFENLEKKTFPTPASLLCVRYVRLIPSNPSQPQNNIFGFKPGKRANQSHHNPSNSLTIQLPTQSNPSLMDNDSIKRNPSSHYSFTLIESNRMFDPGGKSHDISLKGSHGQQFRNP
ncbi:zinc finger, CCHC-type containing protein [Tanacetum coccineum]